MCLHLLQVQGMLQVQGTSVAEMLSRGEGGEGDSVRCLCLISCTSCASCQCPPQTRSCLPAVAAAAWLPKHAMAGAGAGCSRGHRTQGAGAPADQTGAARGALAAAEARRRWS
jgi:hypothetical protein